MYKEYYQWWYKRNKESLQGDGFYPLPPIIKNIFSTFKVSSSRQMSIYAQMLEGVDLSFLAPNEYGCMEAVSRIWNELFGYRVLTWTPDGARYMQTSGHFIQINSPEDGCIIIAVTGTGNGRITNGHAGVCIGNVVMSNRSKNGKWEKTHSIRAFIDYYQKKGGMKVLFFVAKKQN